ncbi:MAG: hypothetical protein MI919_02385 [Holophagales bacterium]|nr:hypothetical protein [Holophagales bacterium]
MARSRPRMLAVLCVVLSFGPAMLAARYLVPIPAALELEVVDATFGERLGGRALAASDEVRGWRREGAVVTAGGRQLVRLLPIPSGRLRLSLEAEGFRPAALMLELSPLEHRRASLGLESLSGRLRITVLDAKSGEPVASSRLVPPGEPSADGPGRVLLLPEGTHTLKARATGYCDGELEVRLAAGQDLEVKLPLSPELTEDEAARAVLDWAENPRDLDAHVLLENTPTAVRKPHVYFSHKKGTTVSGEVFAELDVDYVHSEGFETTTLSSRVKGTYRYFVHLFAGEGTLGTSEATVRISTRGCKQKTYRVPTDCEGRFWNVVDIKVDDTIDILERRECSADPPRRWKIRKDP